jgi:hypothetical protein
MAALGYALCPWEPTWEPHVVPHSSSFPPVLLATLSKSPECTLYSQLLDARVPRPQISIHHDSNRFHHDSSIPSGCWLVHTNSNLSPLLLCPPPTPPRCLKNHIKHISIWSPPHPLPKKNQSSGFLHLNKSHTHSYNCSSQQPGEHHWFVARTPHTQSISNPLSSSVFHIGPLSIFKSDAKVQPLLTTSTTDLIPAGILNFFISLWSLLFL